MRCFCAMTAIFSCMLSAAAIYVSYIFSVGCFFSVCYVFSVCYIIFYRMLEVLLLFRSTVSSTSLYFEAIPHAPDCLNILRLRRIEFYLLANLLDVDRYGRDVTD